MNKNTNTINSIYNERPTNHSRSHNNLYSLILHTVNNTFYIWLQVNMRAIVKNA